MSLREVTGNNLPNGFGYHTRTISGLNYSFTSSLEIDQYPWPTNSGQGAVEFKCTNYPVALTVTWNSSTVTESEVVWYINGATQVVQQGSLPISLAENETLTIVVVPTGGGGGGIGTHTYTISFTAPDPTPVKPKRSYTESSGSPSLLAGELAVDVMDKVIYMGREHSDQVNLGPLVVYDSSVANPKNIITYPGQVMLWAGSTMPGASGQWFACNGQAINRSTYSALFAVIGTAYGVGDGEETFNLPSLQAPTHLVAPLTGNGVVYMIKT